MRVIIGCLLIVLHGVALNAQTPGYFDLTVRLRDGRNILRDEVIADLKVTVLPDNVDTTFSSVVTNYDGYVTIRLKSNGIVWTKAGEKNIKIEGKPSNSDGIEKVLAEKVKLPASGYANTLFLPYYQQDLSKGQDSPLFHINSINGNAIRGTSNAGMGDAIFGHLQENNSADGFSALKGVSDDLGGVSIWGQNNKSGAGGRIGDQWHSGYFWGKPFRIDANENTLLLVGKNASFIEFYPFGDASINGGGRKGWIGYDRTNHLSYVNDVGNMIFYTRDTVFHKAKQHVFENGPILAKGFEGKTGRSLSYYTYLKSGKAKEHSHEVKINGTNYYTTTVNDYTGVSLYGIAFPPKDIDEAYPYSIMTDYRVLAGEYNAKSDLRIKKLNGEVEGQQAYHTIKNIPIWNYTYTDPVKFGNKPKIGFIAQHLDSIFPSSVSKIKGIIPNILKFAEKIEENNQSLILTIRLDTVGALSPGEIISIIGNKEHLVEVLSINGKQITVKGWPEEDTKEVFVYGKQVDDFRTVDYDQIFALNVAATQALIEKVETLEEQVSKLQKENEILRTSNSEVLKRLGALESSLKTIIGSNKPGLDQNKPISSQKK